MVELESQTMDVPLSTPALEEGESSGAKIDTLNLPPDAKHMTQDEISNHVFFMREALAMVCIFIFFLSPSSDGILGSLTANQGKQSTPHERNARRLRAG
jgi:hypothetical protein